MEFLRPSKMLSLVGYKSLNGNYGCWKHVDSFINGCIMYDYYINRKPVLIQEYLHLLF